MATASNGLQNLVGLAQLIGSFQNKNQSTTQTSQTNMDQAGVDRLVQQMLSGSQGVKSIAGAARGAGLYNSSTEQQQLNDLYARTAGEVSSRTAPTTTTQSQQIQGQGLTGMLAPLAISMVGKPLLERGLGYGAEALGLTGGTGANALAANTISGATPDQLFAANASTDPLGVLGTTLASGGAAGALNGAIPAFGQLFGAGIGAGAAPLLSAGVTGAAGAGAGSLASLLGGDLLNAGIGGTGASLGASATAGAAGEAAAGALGGAGLGGPAGMLWSLLNGNATGDSLAMGGIGMGASALLAPVFGPAAPLVGGLLGSMGSSVVCTALIKRGLLSAQAYMAGSEYLASLSPNTIAGYYSWGKALARKIDNGSKVAIALSLPVARSRTMLLTTSGGLVNHLRYPLGTITKFVGEPLCWLVGSVISLKERINGRTITN